MDREEQEDLLRRTKEIVGLIGGDSSAAVTAASLLLLGDRLVGMLDGIRAGLRLIEDQLNSDLDERTP
jgi:hypothetical protein